MAQNSKRAAASSDGTLFCFGQSFIAQKTSINTSNF